MSTRNSLVQWEDVASDLGGKQGGSREKYVRREAERLGVAESEIPVLHAGGTSRPLHTPSTWEPNPGSEDEEVVYPLTQPLDLEQIHLIPKAKLWDCKLERKNLIPKATGPSSPYEGGRRQVFLESGSSGSVSTASGSKDLQAVSASSGSKDLQVTSDSSRSQDVVIERVLVTFDRSVELFVWDRQILDPNYQRTLTKFAGSRGQIEKSGFDCVVFDWRQVLDTDRETKRWTTRISADGKVPPRHSDTLWNLRRLISDLKAECEIVICSHIHESEGNRQRLLATVQTSQLPVGTVIITTERDGPIGKYHTLRKFTSGRLLIFDDNESVLKEFLRNSSACCQVRKPRAPVLKELPDPCVGWSISSEPLRSNAENFIRFCVKHPK